MRISQLKMQNLLPTEQNMVPVMPIEGTRIKSCKKIVKSKNFPFFKICNFITRSAIFLFMVRFFSKVDTGEIYLSYTCILIFVTIRQAVFGVRHTQTFCADESSTGQQRTKSKTKNFMTYSFCIEALFLISKPYVNLLPRY